jgi:hypothetical protein
VGFEGRSNETRRILWIRIDINVTERLCEKAHRFSGASSRSGTFVSSQPSVMPEDGTPGSTSKMVIVPFVLKPDNFDAFVSINPG